MSKRGPLDAYFAKLPNAANKKAKQADVAGKELQTDSGQQLDTNSKQHGSSDQQVQGSVLQEVEQQQQRQTVGEVQPGSESTAAAAGNQQGLTAEPQEDVAVQQPAAAAMPAVAPNNAFGALMAASKGKTPVGSDSSSSKLSAEEMQQQADRNQAAATAVVQEAAAAQQHPQLKSLLVEPSWLQILAPEFEKPYMRALQGFLQQEWASQVIYPPQDSIFRAFNAVPFDQVRVVILGQDPYINAEAMGLSFSVPPGIRVPPSLVNIYKELGQDIGAKIPKHGCLKKWCSQGVLLLNAALTVRAKNSNSHAGKGWESFTSAALTALAKQRSGIVFMLWGKYAQDRCAKLNLKKHHVLKSVHPSPLSAHRGFLGCRHFSTANKMLVQAGQPAIDWQIDDA